MKLRASLFLAVLLLAGCVHRPATVLPLIRSLPGEGPIGAGDFVGKLAQPVRKPETK